MPTLVGSLTRAAARVAGGPLNVLTFPTHEAYQTCLAATGHNFYLLQGEGIKNWNPKFRPLPANHVLLDPAKGNRQVPAELDFDLVLSQNKFGQFPNADAVARQLHLPLVSLEHTLPVPGWGQGQLKRLKAMRGDVNVFISEFSRAAWGWREEEGEVIHHGVDTDLFGPSESVEPRAHALSVVNDWRNRDWCCGYRLWEEATAGLPVRVVGDTPGLSEPAKSTAHLVAEYQSARVFVNTSLVSPVPTALLEAMACGCAVVTTGTCMIPEVVRDGENGLIADDPPALRAAVRRLLDDPGEAARLGRAARLTVARKFSLREFVRRWRELFNRAADVVYKGER